MQTQLLFLDSDHANQLNNTPSDLIFNLNFSGANDLSGYAISIQSVVIPNMVYPINSKNNKLYWSEDGGSIITSTITPNNYTGTQFATELQTTMNTDSGLGRTYGVSFDSQSKKLTITESVGLPNTFHFYTGTNDIISETGFDGDGSVHSTSYIADYPVYLAGTQYLDIQVDLTSNNYSSNGKSNIIERIPVNVNFGSIIVYQNTTDDYIRLNEDSINTLEIRILDDKGNLYELPANAQVSIVCKLSQFL